MRADFQGFQEELEIAGGRRAGDLMLQNLRILDVYSERIFEGSLLIGKGKILAVNPPSEASARQVFDGSGRLAVPGFIDAHMHIETSLVAPEGLAAAIVPWGTTSVFAEILDFVSVTDAQSAKALLRDRARLPYRVFVAAPAKVVPPEVTYELLHWDAVVSLGEMIPGTILDGERPALEKLLRARAAGRLITGHVPNLPWPQLNALAAAGLRDDHETLDCEGTLDLLRLGISKVIRRGSTLDTVEPILRGVLEEGIPTEHLMFCCDDAYVNDLMREGHVNAMIQGAISAGLDPIKAIKMGSFNAARHFHMEDRLGSLTPGRFADIVLLKDLEEVRPTHVFHAGELVAQDGELLQELRWAYPQLRVEPRPGLQGLRPQDLALHASGRAEVPLLDLTAQPPITSTATLEASQGRLEADPQRDLLKLCLLERYPQGERQIRKLFAHGFSLHEGALAISFTQGGPQITAVGADDGDMVLAAKAVDAHPGGLALAAHGEVLGTLPLPLAGMMSDLPTREVAARLERLHQAARELGCDLPSPFMTLWFAPFHLRR